MVRRRPAVRRAASAAHALLRSRGGNIAIEFAFLAPVLVLLTMGTVELGRMIVEQLRLTSAAQAAVQYGAHDLNAATDTSGIAATARAQLGSAGGDLNVTSRSFCLCPDLVETVCGSVCLGSEPVRRYLEVAVNRDVALLFTYPFGTGRFALSSVKAMRIN